MSGPLKGLKILELTSVVLGPWAAQILADMGAEVIKVEAPFGEDIIDYFASIGAASNQIGRAYDYLGYLYEPSKELLMNIKNSVDPKNKMNTGTLGFKDNF